MNDRSRDQRPETKDDLALIISASRVMEDTMPFQRRVLVTVAFVVVFASGYATGQRQPPTANVGQSEQALRSLDLTGEMETTAGRPLRMRKITLQPGGVLGIHNHV